MNPLVALVILAILLVVTVGIGLTLHWAQNRPRRQNPAEVVDPHRLGADSLGSEATLLQFSTEMCARCPGMHRTLGTIADSHEGVSHLDVDLTDRPDIARHFHVLQTPTTFILDGNGVIRSRFGGTPARGVIELELSRILTPPVSV